MKKTVTLLVILAALTACKSHKDTALATGINHPDSIFATLERQPCFGRCPAFFVTVYNSGKAIYQGTSSVQRLGKWSGSLSKDQLKMIADKAMEFRLDTLKDEYIIKELVDFPGSSFSVIVNGHLKQVRVMDTNPPPVINKFENFLQEIFDGVQWSPVATEDKK